MENYKNVSQDIRNQLDAEVEAVQIIFTGIDNKIYFTVDACPNACEMWKAVRRLKQGESISVQDLETNLYWEIGKFTSRDGESLKSYYLRSQPAATRNRGTQVVQHSGIQCCNCKEYGHVPRQCQKLKRRDDTDDEPEDQELEAHYMYMEHIQEVTLDAADNSGPIFDVEPLQKVQNNNDNYNVFAIESEHPEQPESVNDTYSVEQDKHNIIIDSLDMSYDREQDDQDDNGDLAKERDLLAFLIKKLKCEIDDSKNHNNFLETSNKALVDKLKGEIEDFKTKNKSLELSNNHFKEANNELSKTNQLMFKDLKKFQAELE
ncbi:gag-pol polyprotein [Tanacetum coccineum]